MVDGISYSRQVYSYEIKLPFFLKKKFFFIFSGTVTLRMFKNCLLSRKRVVAPTNPNVLSSGPIAAIEAQRDASTSINEEQNARNQFVQRQVIARIWEMIHKAKNNGAYKVKFDDDCFGQRITFEDYSFISHYFEDTKFKYDVRMENYRYSQVAFNRPVFLVEVCWDVKFEENPGIPIKKSYQFTRKATYVN
jgi:hypothetical protein